MSFVENLIFMFSKDSLPVITNHEFHNYCCGSVLVSCFSSSTSLWKALRKNWINTSLRWWRWRYGSVEMSDKTGPHLTLIDCKPQRPLWIPKSENWFWNEDSSLKILVFALQQRIKAKLQELPCPFEPEDAQGACSSTCHDILLGDWENLMFCETIAPQNISVGET